MNTDGIEIIDLCKTCIHYNKGCNYPFSVKDMKQNKDGIIIECLYYKNKQQVINEILKKIPVTKGMLDIKNCSTCISYYNETYSEIIPKCYPCKDGSKFESVFNKT